MIPPPSLSSWMVNLWDIFKTWHQLPVWLSLWNETLTVVQQWTCLSSKRSMTTTMTLLQTNILSVITARFVLAWVASVRWAMFICSFATCDLNSHWIPSLCGSVISVGGREPERRGHSRAISSGSRRTPALSLTEREAVKRSELLACSSKHPLSVRAPPRVNTLLHHKSWIHGQLL